MSLSAEPTRQVVPPVRPDPPAAIELENLTKVYPGRRNVDGSPLAAVDGISLRIGAGQVFGLLGPNGAGKSTTIRMIATLLEPTSGRIRVCNIDAATRQRDVRRLLGVALGGERSTYWKLTARQNLEYFAALYGESRRRSRARIQEVLDRVGLGDRADDPVEIYSTGMRQRLVLARALLNRPAVVLLDEPTTGLDPHASATMHELVGDLRDAGHTIVLTTHYMEEADALSDRLGIIDGGRLVAEGTSAELKASVSATQVVHLRVRSNAFDAFIAALREEAEIDRITADALTLRSRLGDDLVPWLISVAGRHATKVLHLDCQPVSLKDVFLTLTGRELTGDQTDE